MPFLNYFLGSSIILSTPGPLYNTVRYNTVLDYNTDWIANKEIGLDPSNSVIKRLRCNFLGFAHFFGNLFIYIKIRVAYTYVLQGLKIQFCL